MKTSTSIFLVLILVITMLSACSSQQEVLMCSDGTIAGNQQITKSKVIYVCPDGKKTTNVNTCTFKLQSSITLSDAEKKSNDYVRGYVSANGWTAQFVNAYLEEGDWYAQLVVAKYNEQSYQTTVKVDGDKGSVNCIQNCLYIE
jgi:hypothetical protein